MIWVNDDGNVIFVCTIPLKAPVWKNKNEEITFSQTSHISTPVTSYYREWIQILWWADGLGYLSGSRVTLYSDCVFWGRPVCSLWCWEWPGNSLHDYSQHQPGQMAECLFTKCNFSQHCAKCSARLRWSASCGHTHTYTHTHTFTWDENKPNCCLAHSWPCVLSDAVTLDKCKCVCVCISTVRSAWEKDGQRWYPAAGAVCVYFPQST